MLDVLPHQLPWWVAGPGVGLCVVALFGLANLKLGVSGGWLQVVLVAQGRPVDEPWRLWFTGGLAIGALAAAVLGTGVRLHGYGDLGTAVRPAELVPLLAFVGVIMGYGARWARGCTSGHGLSGCSVRSPESLAATAAFFSVAVAVTLLVHVLSGGAV